MDRVLKFRAWDGQCMYPFDLSQIDAGSIMTSFDSPNNRESWTSLSDMTVMQFTGLKDCKGVEIYEGDVVKFSSYYFGDSYCRESVEVIKWDTCQWNDNLWVGSYDHPDWCEVIGNIHQNPELIEG